MTAPPPEPVVGTGTRQPMLDGWRAVSILLVIAGHLLPLGPADLGFNAATAATGMAIFFTLSGFLICQVLLRRPDPKNFLIRRVFRIVPLAWLAVLILAAVDGASWSEAFRNLLFVSNYPPAALLPGGDHLWSLCVEVQFYFAVALLVWVSGRRGLYLLPAVAVGVTLARIVTGTEISIETPYRVDEILAGAVLALVVDRCATSRELMPRIPQVATVGAFVLLFFSAHPGVGALAYGRPYFAAAAVGLSLYSAPVLMRKAFESRPALYVATISYALYVVHLMLAATWLGGPNDSVVVKYLKRPLLFIAVWVTAHISTFRFERPMTDLGRRIADKAAQKGVQRPVA